MNYFIVHTISGLNGHWLSGNTKVPTQHDKRTFFDDLLATRVEKSKPITYWCSQHLQVSLFRNPCGQRSLHSDYVSIFFPSFHRNFLFVVYSNGIIGKFKSQNFKNRETKKCFQFCWKKIDKIEISRFE